MHDIFRQLLGGQSLTETQAEGVFSAILSGEVDEAQIGALLGMITMRGPTTDELVGGVRVMRRFVTPVVVPTTYPADAAPVLVDTCGTGGAPKMFNISTAGAIVTAAAMPGKVMVAKHGSLSRSGRGSAEVMQALGVNIAADATLQARCLREIGLCFSFAVHHHPAMKYAAGPRKSLGFPTIFNLLGPLTNPAGARRQLVGTYSRDLSLKVAETLARVGVDRAMVVTSHDGLDELTTTQTNITHIVQDGQVVTRIFDAATLGFQRARIEQLQVHSLEQAAQTIRDIVSGVHGPTTDVVLLNAGAALFVAGLVESIGDGVFKAQQGISAGRAKGVLDDLIRITNGG